MTGLFCKGPSQGGLRACRSARFSGYAGTSFDTVNLLLTMHSHLACGAGARWSNSMSGNEEQADANLLSAFALTIGGAVGIALPLTIVIIWICS
jgi:hypothetical protein